MWPYLRNVAKKSARRLLAGRAELLRTKICVVVVVAMHIFVLLVALMGSSVTKAKCALERFFIYCPAPPFMNVAIHGKFRENLTLEQIYMAQRYDLFAEMDPMGSSMTRANCALERFFIYCPAPLFMNVAILEKCSEIWPHS